MKTVKCIITAGSVTIKDTTVTVDPPLSVEEFSEEMRLLRGFSEELNEQRIRELGERLFQRVFAEAALEQYRSSNPATLALILSDDLAALPWELLHDGDNWTARTRGMVRVATTEQASPEIIPKPGALKVLAAIAGPILHDDESLPDDDPKQPGPIDVKAQVEILRGLVGTQFPAEIKLREHVTREQFSREVSENYHVLHFVGHGNVSRLVFETRHGIADLAEEDWIREQITVALRGGLRLVALNSCFSANASDEMPGVAATILETGVPAVIAMRDSVSEAADIAFVRNLYGDLARGKPMDEAVMNARRAMKTDWQIRAWEWATPVLFVNESLLDEGASLSLMDAGMAEMMSDPKVSIIEPPKAEPDPMMSRDEKFVGRRCELSGVLSALDPESQSSVKIVCLHGAAGMGKTAIAIEAAHRMAGWFDDVIWLSGRTAPPDELKEHVKADDPLARISGAEGFLTSLAHKCEVELRGYEEPAQLRNAVLKNLNDNRRKLLVLDSMERFARSDLVKSLLINLPANCKTLITSRESLEINEKPIHVGPMNSLDSAGLVIAYGALKNLKADSRELGEIIHRTGGHPLAMRLLVSQVTAGEKTLEKALEDLGEAEGDIFDYIFKRSLGLAGQNGRKIFAAMAIFLPNASRKALQSVCGLSETEFEKTIKRVVGLSLVEQYEQGKRFGLHQLARAKAQQQLESDSDSEKYHERVAQFFMEFVKATAPMTDPAIAVQALTEQMPGGALGKQMIQGAAMEIFVKPAIRSLETELVNCLLALEWALDRDNLDMAMEFLNDLAHLLIVSGGYWDAAAHYYAKTVESCRNRGEHHAEAVALCNLGLVYYRQSKWKDAIEIHESALKMAQQIQDRELEATILNGLGTVHSEQKEWNEAGRCLENSRNIFRLLGNERMEGLVLGGLGGLHIQMGQWNEAAQYFRASLEICERLNERGAQANALSNLGICCRNQGQFEDALEFHRRSLKIYEDLGTKSGQEGVLNNLGIIYEEQGHLIKAMQCYQNSLEINYEIGHRAGQRIALNNLAFIHSKQKQWMEAASACLESFQIATQIHASIVRDSLVNILHISRSMLSSGEFAIPAQLVQQLSQLIQSVQMDDEEMRLVLAISHGVFTIIGFMAMCEGDKGSDVYKEALELARSLDGKTGAALKLVEWLEEKEEDNGK